MGSIDAQFDRLRDTRANIKEEIQSILFCSDIPLGIRSIRLVLHDRHKWSISYATVLKFVNELISEGLVELVGQDPSEGLRVDVFNLKEEVRDVRRRGCTSNALYYGRAIQKRNGSNR